MGMLAEMVDCVIGVDPAADHVVGAAIDSTTFGAIDSGSFQTTSCGYDLMIEWADTFSEAESRAWAVEGAGSYGAGLVRALRAQGELISEFSFPESPAAPDGSKTDHLDARRAAVELLGRDVIVDPRNLDGAAGAVRVVLRAREMMVKQRTAQINQFKAFILTAPVELRDSLREMTTAGQVRTCARYRPDETRVTDETQATKLALKQTGGLIEDLNIRIKELTATLNVQVKANAPQLLERPGVGVICAAVAFTVWSHRGRIKSEGAFAKIAGSCPVPATTGKNQTKMRLNHGGDRQLNRALYTTVITNIRHHKPTQDYIAKATANGRTKRDAIRALKTYNAKAIYRTLQRTT